MSRDMLKHLHRAFRRDGSAVRLFYENAGVVSCNTANDLAVELGRLSERLYPGMAHQNSTLAMANDI